MEGDSGVEEANAPVEAARARNPDTHQVPQHGPVQQAYRSQYNETIAPPSGPLARAVRCCCIDSLGLVAVL